jgi:2-dehydropantoate 2-reductase
MKIGVMGAGSIGCYVGGRLAARGVDTVLLGRARVKEEIETHGMRLTGMSAPEVAVAKGKVRVETEPRALEDRDVVLMCVKSAQTDEAGRSLADVIPARSLVVSMQNGVRNADVLRGAMPKHAVLGGIVGFNVVSKGEGVFHRGTSGPLAIESTEPERERTRELASILRDAGFEVTLPTDIRSKQWSKLLMNLNNAVSALSGAPTPVLIFTPGYRRVLRAVILEALRVLEAAHISPGRLGAIPVGFFPFVLGLPTPLLRVVARAQLKIDPEARSSMWEDLERRRTTEVDWLNGEIVRLAKEHGATAPLNERIVEMVHAAESAAKGSPGLAPDDFWSALTAAR